MKPIHFTLLLILLLTACAPAQTLTRTPSATQAPQAAPTATATARPTVTPTPTEDPLAGAPEGATGKDKDGNWIRPATNPDGTPLLDSHGKQVYETWYTFPSGPNGETISGWFEDHIKDGTSVPIMDAVGDVKAGLPMRFIVKDGINTKYLQHEKMTGVDPGVNYISTVRYLLIERYFGKPISKTTQQERSDFLINIWPDNFSITLTDAQGNPHTIYGDTSFTVVLVEPEDIPSPDYKIPKAQSKPHQLAYYIFDDKAHAVTILVANEKPLDQLSDFEFMDTLLSPIGHILVFSDLSMNEFWNDPGKSMKSGSLANMALKGEHPYFVISDSP